MNFSQLDLPPLKDAFETADRPALIGLVIANIVPLICALVFQWDLSGVVIIYWWENVIIGFYSLLRILLAQGGTDGEPKFFIAPFFCFHYFFFCFIHGIFVLVLTSKSGISSTIDGNPIVSIFEALPLWGTLSLIGIFISHGISFVRYYIRGGEYKTATVMTEMFKPYGRIVLLHVCIIAGGFVTMMLGTPLLMIILLIIGKTIMDLGIHVLIHGKKKSGEETPA